jgi:hypothetical protein
MAKRKPSKQKESAGNSTRRIVLVAAITAAVAAAVAVSLRANREDRSKTKPPQSAASAPAPTTTPASEQSTPPSELVTMDVAKSVMVTVELDFGKKTPTIAEALTQVERRYQPDDGQGRTFAVLDAYGEPTPDGKLHMSMHLSSEKPGGGQLIFKKTGEVLWHAKINPTSMPIQPKTLTIIVGEFTVDGSTKPGSIIEATVKPGDRPVRDIWPDGQERDMTFIYSACGCPVHVQTKRVGDRTVRVKDTPVVFPDDPEAVALITKFMRW